MEFHPHKSGFGLAICKSQFLDQLCLFADPFKQFVVKFTNQNVPSVRIFVLGENTNFLFKLQACHISAYLKL